MFKSLSEEGNAVVLAGDFNCSIGSSVLVGNNDTVSKGGKLLNNLLETDEDIILVNERYPGDPITHVDASGGAGKVLDLVLANNVAEQQIEDMLVDEELIITPYRYQNKTKSRVYTDHKALYWNMNVVEMLMKENKSEKPIWNKKKMLGDGRFAFHLDRNVNKIVRVMNNNADIDTVMNKMNREVNNAKHRGYGKASMDPKTWKKIEDEKMAAYKWNKVKEVIDKVKEDGRNRTVPLQVFAMRKSKLMADRGETLSSVRHPVSGELMQTKEQVFRATVKHNEMVLSQNKGQCEAYRHLLEFKREYVEWAKLQESDDPRDDTIYLEEYQETVKDLVSRNKSVYSDMKVWGPQMRIVVYWMMRRMYEVEEIPKEFLRTELQPLYKGKGPRCDLSNYRFLHLKSCFTKLFEAMVMKKVKADLWEHFTRSQVGGLPCSRTSEHLYVVMSIFLDIAYEKYGLEGVILIIKDVKKAFDKLSAIHTLFATAQAGVKGRNLRLLEMLNKETTYQVVGDPEATEFVKEYVGGQGTAYMAPAASLTMPQAMQELIARWEEENMRPLGVVLGPDKNIINECEFVDDQLAFCADADAAREKGRLITMAMDQINVEVHPTKTRYMIIGNPDYVERVEESLEKDPIVIQGFEVERTESEKYLGMMINANGARATVEEQMKYRVKECDGKMAVVINMMEDPTMRGIGYLAGVRTLFESVISSTALYSSGVWTGLTKAMMEGFDKECKRILYTILKLNMRTTFLQVCYELDILPWSYGIWREKLSLATFLCHDKVGQAGMVAVSEARRNIKYGLMWECRQWCEKHGLPDPSTVRLSTETISEKVKEVARADMWQSVVSSKFVKMNLVEMKHFPTYIYEDWLSNHQQKIILCYRLGILEFKRRFSHKYSDVTCIYSKCDQEEDTYEHSLVCRYNRVKKPKNKNNLTEVLKYLESLHSDRLARTGIPLYYL